MQPLSARAELLLLAVAARSSAWRIVEFIPTAVAETLGWSTGDVIDTFGELVDADLLRPSTSALGMVVQPSADELVLRWADQAFGGGERMLSLSGIAEAVLTHRILHGQETPGEVTSPLVSAPSA